MSDSVSFTVRYGSTGGLPQHFTLSREEKDRVIRIGRAGTNDVVIRLAGISWNHAELKLIEDASGRPVLAVKDTSSNGTGMKTLSGGVQNLKKGVDTVVRNASMIILPMKVKGDTDGTGTEGRTCFGIELDECVVATGIPAPVAVPEKRPHRRRDHAKSNVEALGSEKHRQQAEDDAPRLHQQKGQTEKRHDAPLDLDGSYTKLHAVAAVAGATAAQAAVEAAWPTSMDCVGVSKRDTEDSKQRCEEGGEDQRQNREERNREERNRGDRPRRAEELRRQASEERIQERPLERNGDRQRDGEQNDGQGRRRVRKRREGPPPGFERGPEPNGAEHHRISERNSGDWPRHQGQQESREGQSQDQRNDEPRSRERRWRQPSPELRSRPDAVAEPRSRSKQRMNTRSRSGERQPRSPPKASGHGQVPSNGGSSGGRQPRRSPETGGNNQMPSNRGSSGGRQASCSPDAGGEEKLPSESRSGGRQPRRSPEAEGKDQLPSNGGRSGGKRPQRSPEIDLRGRSGDPQFRRSVSRGKATWPPDPQDGGNDQMPSTGDEVEALYRGRWDIGKVLSNAGGNVRVYMHTDGREYDFQPSDIRLISGMKVAVDGDVVPAKANTLKRDDEVQSQSPQVDERKHEDAVSSATIAQTDAEGTVPSMDDVGPPAQPPARTIVDIQQRLKDAEKVLAESKRRADDVLAREAINVSVPPSPPEEVQQETKNGSVTKGPLPEESVNQFQTAKLNPTPRAAAVCESSEEPPEEPILARKHTRTKAAPAKRPEHLAREANGAEIDAHRQISSIDLRQSPSPGFEAEEAKAAPRMELRPISSQDSPPHQEPSPHQGSKATPAEPPPQPSKWKRTREKGCVAIDEDDASPAKFPRGVVEIPDEAGEPPAETATPASRPARKRGGPPPGDWNTTPPPAEVAAPTLKPARRRGGPPPGDWNR